MVYSAQSLLDELRAHVPDMLEDLAALVALESPSLDRESLDLALDFLSEKLTEAGAELERREEVVGNHLLARWPGESPAPRDQVLVVGHADTVWPIGELARRPIRRDDQFFYGPGAFDMKAGLIITIHAMKALRDLGHALDRDVVFIVNTDEEIGSRSSRQLVEREARRSCYAFVMEPALDEDYITVARKGIGRFTVRVDGRAAHSGNNHDQGVNAIVELAHQVLALESLTDYERGSTVNVGLIEGGVRSNVVPPAATAHVDLRVTSVGEGRRMVKAIKGLTPRDPRATLTVEGGLTRPPWELGDAGKSLFRRAQAVGRALGMDLKLALSGGGSDGSTAAALGILTLDGLGPTGAGAHAIDERVRISSLAPRAALLAGLIYDVANSGKENGVAGEAQPPTY